MVSEWYWSSLIEKDSHRDGRAVLSSDFSEALLGVLKNGDDLLWSYARKPLQELIDGGTRFQVFEKRSHGYAGSAKNPGPADSVFRTLHFRTIGPIQHAVHDMLLTQNRARVQLRSFLGAD